MKLEKKSLKTNQSVEPSRLKKNLNFGVKKEVETDKKVDKLKIEKEDSQDELIKRFGSETLSEAYRVEYKMSPINNLLKLFMSIYMFFSISSTFSFLELKLIVTIVFFISVPVFWIAIYSKSLSFNENDLNNFELIRESVLISLEDYQKNDSHKWNNMTRLPYRLKKGINNQFIFEWRINKKRRTIIKDLTFSQIKSLKTAEDVEEIMKSKR